MNLLQKARDVLFRRGWKRCPAGTLHAPQDQVCYCRFPQTGRIWDFRLERELVPYTEPSVKRPRRQTMWD